MFQTFRTSLNEILDIYRYRSYTFASVIMAFYGMSKALRITAMGWYIYDVTNEFYLDVVDLVLGLDLARHFLLDLNLLYHITLIRRN